MEIDYDKLADKIVAKLKKKGVTGSSLFTKNNSEKEGKTEKKKGLLLDLLQKKKVA
jgi:hypothetical protein